MVERKLALRCGRKSVTSAVLWRSCATSFEFRRISLVFVIDGYS